MSVKQIHLVIEQLIRDNPKFHYYSEEQVLKEKTHAAKFGYDIKPGVTNWAVHPDILRGMQEWVSPAALTIETGCGQTTVALASLARRHICVTLDKRSCRAVEAYMDGKGLSRSTLSFMEESSETALPTLSLSDKLDFAYIDGCHGYPFPALDWYFIDKHLKVGGVMAFDNTEIPTVKYHCDFLDANRPYTLVQTLTFKDWGGYSMQLYRKAERFIQETCARQEIGRNQLTIHADRGSAMTSKPVAFLLADLGVTKTHSRPHVSNDNPFSEAQFKTLKYRPDFPERFGVIQDARAHCHVFFPWYNTEHHHAGLGLLTPADVHHGLAEQRVAARRTVLATAYAAHPERFLAGLPHPPARPAEVWINPPKAIVCSQPSTSAQSSHLSHESAFN